MQAVKEEKQLKVLGSYEAYEPQQWAAINDVLKGATVILKS